MLKSIKDVVRNNEAKANKNIARIMLSTFFVFCAVYVLNVAGVFIIDKTVMTLAYAVSSLILLSPLLLNKVFGPDKHYLKYLYVTFAAIFIFVITVTLTKHAVAFYCFPICLAGLYFSKKMIRFASILTILVTTAAQCISYILGEAVVPDFNVISVHHLIFFFIIPRDMVLVAIAAMFNYLTDMTTGLLEEQKETMDEIQLLNNDILSGFATLVESRDENTGGHVKRTSRYVELIIKRLQEENAYPELLTDDLAENTIKAAPMHDIGKISVSDIILQKPGKLTDEEYAEMKKHTVEGGKIIKETFRNVEDEKFRKVVFDVARHHHEKWNGKGYPDQLKGEEIPLAARIMAVADVFDAVSQKRCYRDAMPLDECFKIIENGTGNDFDPVVATAFLNIKDQVKATIKEI